MSDSTTGMGHFRELLDALGVEYEKINDGVTRMYLEDRVVTFYGADTGLSAEVTYPKPVLGGTVWLTPEQAIAATLGSGECDMTPTFTEPARIEGSYQEWECSECGEFTLIECMSGGNELPNFCIYCGRKVKR